MKFEMINNNLDSLRKFIFFLLSHLNIKKALKFFCLTSVLTISVVVYSAYKFENGFNLSFLLFNFLPFLAFFVYWPIVFFMNNKQTLILKEKALLINDKKIDYSSIRGVDINPNTMLTMHLQKYPFTLKIIGYDSNFYSEIMNFLSSNDCKPSNRVVDNFK